VQNSWLPGAVLDDLAKQGAYSDSRVTARTMTAPMSRLRNELRNDAWRTGTWVGSPDDHFVQQTRDARFSSPDLNARSTDTTPGSNNQVMSPGRERNCPIGATNRGLHERGKTHRRIVVALDCYFSLLGLKLPRGSPF
jgi:hypothetical protein